MARYLLDRPYIYILVSVLHGPCASLGAGNVMKDKIGDNAANNYSSYSMFSTRSDYVKFFYLLVKFTAIFFP